MDIIISEDFFLVAESILRLNVSKAKANIVTALKHCQAKNNSDGPEIVQQVFPNLCLEINEDLVNSSPWSCSVGSWDQ